MAVHDTIVETVTIVVRENEQGDTLRLDKVTERDRIRDRAQVVKKEVEVRLVRDTVYVERRDSTSVSTVASDPSTSSVRAPAWLSALKWFFWIIVSLTVLIVVFKLTRRF